MCKFNKILSTLLLGLMVAGCDVEALPKDYEETYGAIDMADVYDTVRNGQGESALYNQVINTIAEKYRGGGHACASGATIYNTEEQNALISDADTLIKEYKETHKEWL